MNRNTLLAAFLLSATIAAHPQARDIPLAATPLPNGQTQETRGRQLLDQMIAALGGPAWLSRSTMSAKGRTAAFFRGQPNGSTIDYISFTRFPDPTHTPAERIEFISDKSMILPGKKRDVAHVFTADNGYEITYKGKSTLPKEQVEDYLRRRHHSVEEVVHTWLKAPGVVVIAEDPTMVERHLVDQVTILSADNDAVTLALDSRTHLPVSRTFTWRNEKFKDHDEDRETYDDYHTIGGLPTPLTLTRYRNGDMINQRFLTNITYNPADLPPDTFDPNAPLRKK